MTRRRERIERLDQMLDAILAERETSLAAITQARATLAKSVAGHRYAQKRYNRTLGLFREGGVERQLVDEAEERRDAAAAAEKAAGAGIKTAEAQEKAAQARIAQADADQAEADADVAVARA